MCDLPQTPQPTDQGIEIPSSTESAAATPMKNDTTISASKVVAVIVRKVLVKSLMVASCLSVLTAT